MPGADLPFAIGGDPWPGLSKLIEEAGEVIQVAGKMIATGGQPHHWDGTHLTDRLEEEVADLYAALDFVVQASQGNPDPHRRLSGSRISGRRGRKLVQFNQWHAEQRGAA